MDTEKLTEAMVRALVERYVLPTEAARLLPLLAQSWLAQREAIRNAPHGPWCFKSAEVCVCWKAELIGSGLIEEAAHGDQ